jgi:HEAT repeats
MTVLVVTSTIGGIAYILGYGQGRNNPSDELLRKMPTSIAVPQVALSTHSIGLTSQEQSESVSDVSLEENCPASVAVDEAASETTRMAKIDIVTELIQDLQSPDPGKRRKAIWDLGLQGDSRAVQPMVDLMMSSDSGQRSLILAAVSEIGIKTLKPVNRALMMSLQDSSSDVRKNGIRDVTRLYDLVGQVSQLLQHAACDSDPEVKETASWALSQFNRIRPLAGVDEMHRLPGELSFKDLEPDGEKAET